MGFRVRVGVGVGVSVRVNVGVGAGVRVRVSVSVSVRVRVRSEQWEFLRNSRNCEVRSTERRTNDTPPPAVWMTSWFLLRRACEGVLLDHSKRSRIKCGGFILGLRVSYERMKLRKRLRGQG